MLYLEEPKGFNPAIEVVGCFIEHDGEIILLHRRKDKTNGNKWGLPAGKVDPGENAAEAMLREIYEETGLRLLFENLSHIKKTFVRRLEHDLIFHIFHAKLDSRPDPKINPSEHKGFTWVSPEDALGLPLIHDLDHCINIHYNH